MAFNPFHRFRKHQKAVMAVMAMVCMFIFIFQFGRGDLIERMMFWLGMRNNRGAEILSDGKPLRLYGQKITTGDLEDLAQRRRMASDFLVRTCYMAMDQLLGKNRDGFKDIANIPQINRILETRRQNEQFMGMVQKNPNLASFVLQGMLKNLSDLDRILAAKATGDIGSEGIPFNSLNANQPRRVNELRGVMRLEIALNFFSHPQLYFLGGASTADSLLDFKVWLHQADVLQIHLTDTALLEAIKQEALERDVISSFDDDDVRAFVVGGANSGSRGYPNQSPASLKSALLDEFRVLMAQTALLGEVGGVRELRSPQYLMEKIRRGPPDPSSRTQEYDAVLSPAAVTPEEFFEFYLRERTTVNVGVLPFKVEDYLSKVTGEPKEEELERLFRKFKNQEPSEESSSPGFKEPAHFRLAWIKTQASQDRYKDSARLHLARPAVETVVAAVQSLGAGSGFVGTVSTAIPAFDDGYDGTLMEQYKRYSDEQFRKGQAEAYQMLGTLAPDSANIYRAGTLSFTLGQLGGATFLGNALAAPMSVAGTAGIYSRGDRAHGPMVSSFIASTGPQALYPSLTFGSVGPLWTLPFARPEPLTPKLVKEQLAEKVSRILAEKQVSRDLEKFSSELDKFKELPKDQLETKTRDLAQKYGFTLGMMEKARARPDLEKDSALKPYKEAFERAKDSKPELGSKKSEFLEQILNQRTALFGLANWRSEANPQPGEAPSEKAEHFASWVFEVEQAKEPDSLNDPGVREKVKAAWRKQRARELARQDAEKLLNELKKPPRTGTQAAAELKARNPATYFDIDGITRLKPDLLTVAAQQRYAPYQIPERLIAKPTPTMVDRFLSIKREGEPLLLSDRPEDQYYLSVLISRVPNLDDPTARPEDLDRARKAAIEEWLQVYSRSALGDSYEPNPLWQSEAAQMQQSYRQKLMASLRLEAVGDEKFLNDGRIRLPDKLQLRTGTAQSGAAPEPMDDGF